MLDRVDESTKKIVENVVRSRLDGREVDYFKFILKTDDDGSRWIDAIVKFKLSPVPVDATQTLPMRSAVIDALSAANDPSNVILDFRFDDKQPIKGFERASRAG